MGILTCNSCTRLQKFRIRVIRKFEYRVRSSEFKYRPEDWISWHFLFPKLLQKNERVMPQIKPRPSPCISYRYHGSLITLSFGAV
jgi:hypothetical protein